MSDKDMKKSKVNINMVARVLCVIIGVVLIIGFVYSLFRIFYMSFISSSVNDLTEYIMLILLAIFTFVGMFVMIGIKNMFSEL